MKFMDDIVLINWSMTTVCNYKCSYCPSTLHDGLYKFPNNTQDILDFLTEIQNKNKEKKIYLAILGGEPTLWPKFNEFLQAVDDNVYIEIMSNGSRPLKWWKNNIDNLDRLYQVVLTYHSEYADKDKFINLCEFLAKNLKNFLHVNIMVPPKDTKCIEMFNMIKEIDNLGVRAKGIRIAFGDKYLAEYTDQEFKIIEASNAYNIKEENIFHFDNTGFYKLSFEKKYTWKNQLCHIGLDSFFIDYDGLIYRANCKVGGNIGKLGNYTLPTTGVICPKKWCPCVADAVIKKEKIND